MGCGIRIHRNILVGWLLVMSVIASAQRGKLHNLEKSTEEYVYHPISPPYANYIGVTDTFGIQRYMHVDSLYTLFPNVGSDSTFDGGPDTLCFVVMGDTTCVPIDSTYITSDPDSICFWFMGDLTCLAYNGAGIATIYTDNDALEENRHVFLDGHYLRFVQAGNLDGFQILPLSIQRMCAIQTHYSTANANTGINAAALEINNTEISSTERNAFIRYQNGTNIYSMGQEQPLLAFTFSDSSNLKNPVWRYYGGGVGSSSGDSLVFLKKTKFSSTLLDKTGDPGSSGNILSSTATGVDWITTASILDGNGLFTAANSNSAVIPSSFIAKTTNSVTWLGNTSSISHTLRGATGSSTASITFQNSDTGTGADGTLMSLGTSEQFNITQREDADLQISRTSGQSIYMPGTQSGAVYEPGITLSGGPTVATEGILNSANDAITTQTTLNKNQNFINCIMGSTADTLFLPHILTAYPASGFTLESCAAGESGVGQEYTITNFHTTDNLTICAYNETASTDDEIDNSLCITLGPEESIIVKCVRYVSSVGYWFSYD